MSLTDLEESITCRPWMRWTAVLIGSVLLYLAVWPVVGDDVIRAIKGPPIRHHAVAVVQPEPAAPGEVVRVRFDQTRRYACPARIVRWWLDEAGNRLVDLPMRTGGYSAIGHRVLEISLRIPPEAAGHRRIGYRAMVIHEGPGCEPGFVTEPPVAWIPIKSSDGQPGPRKVG